MKAVFVLLCCAFRVLWAQGGSAIITLVVPPPGDAGFAALQSGAALAGGASAAYYNPAALAELQRSTGSFLGATRSEQDLIPKLGLPGMRQTFWAADAVAADSAGGADLGVGFFRNHVDFGIRTDADANRFYTPHEDIWGLGIGVRLGLPISLGVSAKYIESHLDQGPVADPDANPARSWAFDLGVLAMPRFPAPAAWQVPLTFTPSAAFTIANLGPDVFYDDVISADPIPRTFTVAAGLTADLRDLVSVTAHWQVAQEWTWRSSKLSPNYNTGLFGRIFCVESGIAYLQDPVGKRHEWHESEAIVLDPVAWARVIADWKSGREPFPAGSMGSGTPFGTGKLMIGKIPVRPRLTFGQRKIITLDDGVRDGQKALYLALSL